jgi:hypothetical protein
MDLKYACQQYFTCMCFLGFIRYNKTFIACGFRKHENLFTHEYHIPLGCCPYEIWYSWVNKFSYFPHQHAINVYYHIQYCIICHIHKCYFAWITWSSKFRLNFTYMSAIVLILEQLPYMGRKCRYQRIERHFLSLLSRKRHKRVLHCYKRRVTR